MDRSVYNANPSSSSSSHFNLIRSTNMSGPIVRDFQHYGIAAFQNSFRDLSDVVGELPGDIPDVVPIIFRLSRWVKTGLVYNENEEPASFRLEGNRAIRYELVMKDMGLSRLKELTYSEIDQLRDRFVDVLTNKFHVPETEHESAICRVFREIASRELLPLVPLELSISDGIYRCRLYAPDVDEEDLEDVVSLDDERTCSICINEFDAANAAPRIARLPACHHVFHRDCILRWLHRKPSCPMCRCPSRKKRKLDEITSSSTPTGPPSNIPRTS